MTLELRRALGLVSGLGWALRAGLWEGAVRIQCATAVNAWNACANPWHPNPALSLHLSHWFTDPRCHCSARIPCARMRGPVGAHIGSLAYASPLRVPAENTPASVVLQSLQVLDWQMCLLGAVKWSPSFCCCQSQALRKPV